ncbi:MAG TPA: hypothetical protein VET90_03175 [Candidatus Binatus sp.]|nr:hypothetical protein [Candidatus Binatus sp.]
MGRPPFTASPSRSRPAFARRRHAIGLAAGAALVVGCVVRAQGFEARNATWRAEVTDRTGTVASVAVLDAAGGGAALASDTVRLQNLDARTIEVAWLGGSCVGEARFSLAPEPNDAIALRYEIGPLCSTSAAAGYAFQIRFVRPVDSSTIDAAPDWGP